MDTTIATVILTGGMARRFGGRRKLFLPYEGRTFLSHITEAFRGFDKIYLSVDTPEPFADLGYPTVSDKYPACGPLGGIVSAMESCEEEALFVAACDMPFVTREAVQSILDCYKEHHGIVLASSGEHGIEPLFGIYPRTILPEAQKMLADGNYKTRCLFEKLKGTAVMVPNASRQFRNINSPEEYTRYIGPLENL